FEMKGALPLIWRRIPERYNLVGSKCGTCGCEYFPARKICPECRRKGKIVPSQMPTTGKIYSYSEVYAAPAGFEAE
ncbi:Zn-ribbon domain-containing OB-fold protein, partial [Streptococcus pyogenes]